MTQKPRSIPEFSVRSSFWKIPETWEELLALWRQEDRVSVLALPSGVGADGGQIVGEPGLLPAGLQLFAHRGAELAALQTVAVAAENGVIAVPFAENRAYFEALLAMDGDSEIQAGIHGFLPWKPAAVRAIRSVSAGVK